ncbi:MAG: HD domain-containing protein, partial [Phycisphaerae bacterium]
LLYYAALLHDIGYMISQKGHHKHSHYLIKNGELRGFTERETDIIALIARFHRKERPKRSHALLKGLPGEDRKIICKLVAILRVANALDRTHFSVVQDVSCELTPQMVKILVHARADSELEIWTSKRHANLFEREFDRSLIVEAKNPTPSHEVPNAASDSQEASH